MSTEVSNTPLSCMDLCPPLLQKKLGNKQSVLCILRLLLFMIDGIIDSQSPFFQEKPYQLFDPHPHEACCQIRTVNALLLATEAFKSPLSLEYQMQYLRRIKAHVQDKMSYFLSLKKIQLSTAVLDFLRTQELIFLISRIDQFIFVTYFLKTYRKKTMRRIDRLDYKKIARTVNVSIKQAKIIGNYYQHCIVFLSEDVIAQRSATLIDQKKNEEFLQISKKQAEAANRAKTEFLENMRHDIRTPLSGIIGFSRLIQEEAVNPRVKEYADNLVLATGALLDFQNEILDAIKITRSQDILHNETFNLKTLVEKVLNLVRPKAILKHLTLSVAIDDRLPLVVCGDAKRLFRILLELVTNALKFTAQGGIQIHVCAEKLTGEQLLLRCEVRDSGIGIESVRQEDIFTRFKRLSPSSDGVYEGTGLGLTVVKKHMKALRGKIYLESTPQVGTTVICLLPLVVVSVDDALEKTTQPTEVLIKKNQRILLVEDHAMTATVTQLMLSALGCVVDIATDVKTALYCVANNTYDFILMDLGLPDGSGFSLAERIQTTPTFNPQKTVMIALTAHQEEESEARCMACGMSALLQKPFLKEQAIKILNADYTAVHPPIIDIALGAKRINKDRAAAESMLMLLFNSLAEDEKNIKTAYEKKEWGALHDANHQLMGGLAYCGAPRLEYATQGLQKALKKGEIDLIQRCAQIVLHEIAQLKTHGIFSGKSL